MTVIKDEAYSVLPNRLDCPNSNMSFAGYDFLRGCAVSLDFGAGALDPKVFRRQLKGRAILERDTECSVRAAVGQAAGPWCAVRHRNSPS
jgi:hypothetical protein